MKKLLERLFFSLMVCVAVLGASLAVFADDLDLSKFEKKSLKDYGGIYNGNLYLASDCSYYVLYFDGTDYYTWKFVEDEGSSLVKLTVEEVNNTISNSDNYNTYNTDDEYYCISSVSAIDNQDIHSFYLFVYDNSNKTFNNLGLFDSAASMVDISTLDLSAKLPELSAEVSNIENGARIKLSYEAPSGVYNIVCHDDTLDSDLYVSDIDDESRVRGTCEFDVYSNGDYTIEAYLTPYISKDIEHSSLTVKVDSISKSVEQEEEEKNADTTSPTITFGDVPNSGAEGDYMEFTMYSDEPAILNFNGVTSDDYVTEMKVSVAYNGDYYYSATDKSSNISESFYTVDFFNGVANVDAISSDRDNQWGTATDNKLPKTGGINLVPVIVFGAILIGGGVFFILKSRSKKPATTDNTEN